MQERRCHNRPVRQDYLDGLVWQHVMALLTDPTLAQAELDRRLDEANAADPATAQRAGAELGSSERPPPKLASSPRKTSVPERQRLRLLITPCAPGTTCGASRGPRAAWGTAPDAVTWELGTRPGQPPLLTLQGDRYAEDSEFMA